MIPEEQYEASMKEALSAQRNEHANKEAHWFALYMASQERVKELEKKIKEQVDSPQ